ncbi:MAG: hypothetical protein P1V97_05585 [Planctomycetota bacterium]|nr:hypothetical protein [Planctomycetota bacterium]
MIQKLNKHDIVSRWQTFHAIHPGLRGANLISRLVRVSHKATGKTLFGNVPEGVYSNEELNERTKSLENQLIKSLVKKLLGS